ncbi:MAG TPA: hypothetical protein VFS43_02520 [Polyangiaceae bacterium]|nr:hypothetical protein [Polyangiaceae bacterium]
MNDDGRSRHGEGAAGFGARRRAFGRFAGALLLLAPSAGLAGCERVRRGRAMLGSDEPEARPASAEQVAEAPAAVASLRLAADHPRLWVRAADLPRLRGWATASNPLYKSGLEAAALEAKKAFDPSALVSGDCNVRGNFCETYAELFAFLSLVAPDAGQREEYGGRAKAILLKLLERADRGDGADPLAGERFATYDRSRWAGEAFPLVVDWVYPLLSPADKALARRVFLRWSEWLLRAQVTDCNHPEPVGLVNSPELVKDPRCRRYALNNYFNAHMRNLGLMALALDEADDPPEPGAKRTYPRLRDYLGNAIGAWLYMADAQLRTEALGGEPPEGFEYGPQTLAYLAQFHLALQTAGAADAAKFGRQVGPLLAHPFWREVIPAYMHQLSPAPVVYEPWKGEEYQPTYYGDGLKYAAGDPIDLFAPFALYAQNAGDATTPQQARWAETHLAEGGAPELLRRARAQNGGVNLRQSIWYFLLFDPRAPPPPDPRPALPLAHASEGLGHLTARTGWGRDASWFFFQNGWHAIDHQHGDGNNFSFYRGGEFLTKERVGYGPYFDGSDQHNTLSLENDQPAHASDDRRASYWRRGSQWSLSPAGDGTIVARSVTPEYLYALGDATGLYNSGHEAVAAVAHASRSIVWLRPDHVVVYDRAKSREGLFKRFFLHTPAVPALSGRRATVTTPKGQRLVVTTLLPERAQLAADAHPPSQRWDAKPALYEPMRAFLRVTAEGAPAEARFLHVLQGASAGDRADEARLVRGSGGVPFVGATFGASAILFPVNVEGPGAPSTAFVVPAGVERVLVTGLVPGARYAVAVRPATGGTEVSLGPGGGVKADGGGVLVVPLPGGAP